MTIRKRSTFCGIAEQWMSVKRHQVKESTFATYQFCLTRHLIPAFGHTSKITEDMVQSYVGTCLRRGASVNTVKSHVSALRQVMRHGAKAGLTDMPEAWDIRYIGAAAPSPSAAIALLSPTHQSQLLAHVRQMPTPRNIGIYISLTMGLRIGEVCGLKWSDIDETLSLLTIRRTVERINRIHSEPSPRQRTSPATCVVQSTPKTQHSARSLPISGELSEMLHRARQSAPTDSFLLTGNGSPTEPRTYREYFKRLLIALGIKPVRFHALRHSFATRCIERGIDCKTVSEILGHSNVGITLNLYTHPCMEQKRRCIEQLVKSLETTNKDT